MLSRALHRVYEIVVRLIGEMYHKVAGPESWYNLPREDGVAYAAQESWVLNDTIRVSIPLCEGCIYSSCIFTGKYRVQFAF